MRGRTPPRNRPTDLVVCRCHSEGRSLKNTVTPGHGCFGCGLSMTEIILCPSRDLTAAPRIMLSMSAIKMYLTDL